jgi:hypothetical protein
MRVTYEKCEGCGWLNDLSEERCDNCGEALDSGPGARARASLMDQAASDADAYAKMDSAVRRIK